VGAALIVYVVTATGTPCVCESVAVSGFAQILPGLRESLESLFDFVAKDVGHGPTSARAVALGGYF
jgi:hypothetical protein